MGPLSGASCIFRAAPLSQPDPAANIKRNCKYALFSLGCWLKQESACWDKLVLCSAASQQLSRLSDSRTALPITDFDAFGVTFLRGLCPLRVHLVWPWPALLMCFGMVQLITGCVQSWQLSWAAHTAREGISLFAGDWQVTLLLNLCNKVLTKGAANPTGHWESQELPWPCGHDKCLQCWGYW